LTDSLHKCIILSYDPIFLPPGLRFLFSLPNLTSRHCCPLSAASPLAPSNKKRRPSSLIYPP
jgi:hypothetical protein